MSYLALGDGPPTFPQDFSCPVVLRIPPVVLAFRLQGCHFLWLSFLSDSSTLVQYLPRSIPPSISLWSGLGSFPFARHYLGNRLFTFFSSGYLDVSVPRVPFITLFIYVIIPSHYQRWVPSFGNLRIAVYLQLPVAYRSLSRPSSAHSAKAFTLRSSSLNRIVVMSFTLRTFEKFVMVFLSSAKYHIVKFCITLWYFLI